MAPPISSDRASGFTPSFATPSTSFSEDLSWTPLSPVIGGGRQEAYDFQTHVVLTVAKRLFEIEIPDPLVVYKLHSKVKNPEIAHIAEVLKATIKLQQAIKNYEKAQSSSLQAESLRRHAQHEDHIERETATTPVHNFTDRIFDFSEDETQKTKDSNQAHVDCYLAALEKRIVEAKCHMHCPAFSFTQSLDKEHIPFLKVDERLLILKNKQHVNFRPTLENLMKAGLTEDENAIVSEGNYMFSDLVALRLEERGKTKTAEIVKV